VVAPLNGGSGADAPTAASREAIAGWGRFPVRPGRVLRPHRLVVPAGSARVLPRGLGRSYGDAAVPAAPDDLVLDTRRADCIVAFDSASGRLTAEAGLSLAEVVRLFLPRGWFPPVTPGTKFVTIGGCVATDVHGKNHHRDGSFGRFVESLTLITADGRAVTASPDREPELFRATVGGMGLTGLIAEVTLRLRPVESAWILEETEGVSDLAAMLAGLRAAAADWPYTVGWIDALASGPSLGRGVLIRGRHARRDEVAGRRPSTPPGLRVPVDAPAWLLSPALMRAFNGLYYRRRGGGRRQALVSCDAFFYPLDAVLDWNRLYGRRGFLQYQCVIPRAAGEEPMAELLGRLAAAGAATFLAVIKDCGPEAPFYLSFPMEGVTLSLDLPYRGPETEALVHELNEVVLTARGRVYLAKDAVTRAGDAERMMPRLGEWRRTRERWDPGRRFRSAQSVRLLGDPA
jgi:decaprenylphospho-beta-D-ribofuranose 2-oxidase